MINDFRNQIDHMSENGQRTLWKGKKLLRATKLEIVESHSHPHPEGIWCVKEKNSSKSLECKKEITCLKGQTTYY